MRPRVEGWIALAVSLAAVGVGCGSAFSDSDVLCSGAGCLSADGGQMSEGDGGPFDATVGTSSDATTGSPGDDDGSAVLPVNDAGFMGPSDASFSVTSCEEGTYCSLVMSALPEAYFRFNEPLSANGLETPHDWSGHQYSLAFSGGATQVGVGDRAPVDIDGGLAVQLGNPPTMTAEGPGGAFFLYDADGGGMPMFSGTTPFTVEAWFRLHPRATGQQELISSLMSGMKMTNGFAFYAVKQTSNPPDLALWHGLAATEGQAYGPGTTELAKSTFYHLAATFDGATAYVYVNGVRGSALSYPGGPGAGVPIQSGLLNGTLDELAIYTRALGSAEVLSHATFSL